jgi:hypothetical protein
MKTKTKTKQKILKVFAIGILLLGNSQLFAQTSSSFTQTVCVGDTEPYTLVDPALGPPAATSTYLWSTTGGTIVGGISIGDNIDINWNIVGVYTVTVVATDIATGCQDSPIDVVVTVEDNANPPVVTNPGAICLGDANPQMTASTDPSGNGSGVFNWYADATLTTLLATAPTYTDITPLNSPTYPAQGTYDYWVTEESANGCEGSATMVTVTVTGLPANPILLNTPYEACFGLANPQFEASGAGTIFNWYDVDPNPLVNPGAIALATALATYTSTESNPSTYTYWVEEEVGSCTSLATSFTFTINPPPASPSVTPLIAGLPAITICEGETPADFVATTGGAAGTFNWYNIDPVANPLAVAVQSGTPFILTPTAPNTYDYWLTETNPITTCVSAPTTATFTINTLPLLPTVTAAPSATICELDVNPIFTAVPDPLSTGTGDFYWYDDDPAINPLATLLAGPIATYQPLQVAVGQYSIWIIETNSTTNCDGIALEVIFEITALPVIPLLAINPVQICFGDPNPAILPIGSASGVNLIWYDDISLAPANQVGTASFTPPATAAGSAIPPATTYSYWVVDQAGTCTSLPLQVDLQINPLPTPGPIWHN